MDNSRISFKRLHDDELLLLKKFLEENKTFDFDMIDSFMVEMNKKNGLFDNCYALVNKTAFIIQRPIGW